MPEAGGPKFPTRKPVDFVVIGSGCGGAVLAKELAVAGFDVVVFEQGPRKSPADFTHDELGGEVERGVGMTDRGDPQSFRRSADEEATPGTNMIYTRTVGGSTVNYTANAWRFRPIDFIERSVLGPIGGTGFSDWPITYEELEPFYSQAEWEVGVSGAPGPHDPPRSRPYPVPPLPVKSSGALLALGARKLGWSSQPAPMAILSRPHNGRPACIHCGFCIDYGCEVSAKSSMLVTMIPTAEATGRCEVRSDCTVHRIETDAEGRASEVTYFDPGGKPQAQRAKAVVLSANGAESPRILLMSESPRFPQGLANSSGLVGKYLMGNGGSHAYGLYEHPLNEYKSVQVTRIVMDFYDSDPQRGFYGGGGIDARFMWGPLKFAMWGLPPGAPRWGPEYKKMLRQYYPRTMDVYGHTTMTPLETNNVTLDPKRKDRFGRPGLCKTYDAAPDDTAAKRWFRDRCVELAEASGAQRVWTEPITQGGQHHHLLGTCRMGNDPATSVVDKFHRAHDVPNLFICDGSSFVSSGRGQPSLTIQALAFRAAHHLVRAAKNGEV